MQEQRELAAARDDAKTLTQEFKQRSIKLTEAMKAEKQMNEEQLQNEKVCIFTSTRLKVLCVIKSSRRASPTTYVKLLSFSWSWIR